MKKHQGTLGGPRRRAMGRAMAGSNLRCMLAELTFKVVYEYEDEQSLERHTHQAEDLTRQALAGHAAMYDVEVTGRRAPVDNFDPSRS